MFDHKKTNKEKLLERVYKLINPLPILGVYPLISGSRIYDRVYDENRALKIFKFN